MNFGNDQRHANDVTEVHCQARTGPVIWRAHAGAAFLMARQPPEHPEIVLPARASLLQLACRQAERSAGVGVPHTEIS